MRLFYLTIFLLFILNSYSKNKKTDTIVTKLHGQGCGIIPTNIEIDYNIKLLDKLNKSDSNNVFIYRHLAMQYYFLFAKEKDATLKETYRQRSIANNIKVVELNKSNKFLKTGSIQNLLLLYALANDCEHIKSYYNPLKKRELKSMDKSTVEYAKKSCNIR